MPMSEEHKEALAQGRREAAAIKRYLKALEQRRPGRPVTLASLQAKLEQINGRLGEETDLLKRVGLVQARLDTEQRINGFEEVDFSELEGLFAGYAAGYSQRKGISYSAWREIGVPAELLRRAGIPRTRRTGAQS